MTASILHLSLTVKALEHKPYGCDKQIHAVKNVENGAYQDGKEQIVAYVSFREPYKQDERRYQTCTANSGEDLAFCPERF